VVKTEVDGVRTMVRQNSWKYNRYKKTSYNII